MHCYTDSWVHQHYLLHECHSCHISTNPGQNHCIQYSQLHILSHLVFPQFFLPHYCTYHTIPVSIHLFAVVLTCYLFLLLLFDLLVLLLILLLMLPLVPFPFLLLMWLIQFTMITISKSFQQTRMTQSRQHCKM